MAACPEETTCSPTARGGTVCLGRCESNADCRSEQGYVCHPAWQVCSPPGLLAPRPPVCSEVSLAPRKRFGEPVQISTGSKAGLYSMEPTATLTNSGEVVVAYMAMNGMSEGNALNTVIIDTKGIPAEPIEFRSEKVRHFDPWLATGRDGLLYLTWLGHDGGLPDRNAMIGLSTSKDGRTWSAPVAAHHAATDCPGNQPGCLDKPMIAVTKAGPYLTYSSAAGPGIRGVSASRPGEAPSVPVGNGVYGDIFVDKKNVLHLAYVAGGGKAPTDRFGDPKNHVEYVRSSDDGKTFSEPIMVSRADEPVPFYFSNAQVLSDTRRKLLYVVYPAGTADGRWDIVLATSRDRGKSWTHLKVNDDEHCANHMVPTAALDARTGTIHLMWAENRGDVPRMVTTTCSKRGQRCQVNEALSSTMATYSFVRHAAEWRGEYDALLIDEKRRIIHAVWTQPVMENGSPISRVFYAHGAL